MIKTIVDVQKVILYQELLVINVVTNVKSMIQIHVIVLNAKKENTYQIKDA